MKKELQAERPAKLTSLQVIELQAIAVALLVAIGEDPHRPGLRDTPRRFANLWREFIEFDAGNTNTAFDESTGDEMVVVSGMRVYSICEHHLLPFSCDVSVGYIPAKKVLGLSKFGRIAHKYAHRLQIQERLVQQIADEIESVTEAADVAVIAAGEHSCMTMRGIRTQSMMTSSIVRGRFKHDAQTRAEFLTIVKGFQK